MAANDDKRDEYSPSGEGGRQENEPWGLFYVGILVLGFVTIVLIVVSIGVLTGWMKW